MMTTTCYSKIKMSSFFSIFVEKISGLEEDFFKTYNSPTMAEFVRNRKLRIFALKMYINIISGPI